MSASRQLFDMFNPVCRRNLMKGDWKWKYVRRAMFWDTLGFLFCAFIGHKTFNVEGVNHCSRCAKKIL